MVSNVNRVIALKFWVIVVLVSAVQFCWQLWFVYRLACGHGRSFERVFRESSQGEKCLEIPVKISIGITIRTLWSMMFYPLKKVFLRRMKRKARIRKQKIGAVSYTKFRPVLGGDPYVVSHLAWNILFSFQTEVRLLLRIVMSFLSYQYAFKNHIPWTKKLIYASEQLRATGTWSLTQMMASRLSISFLFSKLYFNGKKLIFRYRSFQDLHLLKYFECSKEIFSNWLRSSTKTRARG